MQTAPLPIQLQRNLVKCYFEKATNILERNQTETMSITLMRRSNHLGFRKGRIYKRVSTLTGIKHFNFGTHFATRVLL